MRKVLYIVGTLILFVFALDLMVSSLQNLGKSAAETILLATSNPFTGLFIGLLITAMIQSSSTTTSLVVAFVASGNITLESAIPIIMGANVGTTITSTIVSLGFINKKKEFRRAVAAGTFHDFFNILTVIILFPLEYYYGTLSYLSQWIAGSFFSTTISESTTTFTPVWSGFNSIIDFLVNAIPSGFVLALLSFALLFTSILLFRKIISGLLMAGSPEKFSRFFFKNIPKSFFWGLVTTAAIRSSTITTSLVVPLVAQKVIPLRKAASFILGANIGTTVTAFIAAILNSNSSNVISIAIAHFLFNFIGVLIFFPVPLLRKIPIELAERLGKLTLRYRLAGFVYILMFFFFIPFSLIYLNKDSIVVLDMTYKKVNYETTDESFYRIVSKKQLRNKSGEWIIYENNATEPSLIYPVYQKNNILFINKKMYLINKAGFCWDGENENGKYNICIDSVNASVKINSSLQFDSVYVYIQRPYTQDSLKQNYTRIYLDPEQQILIKRERFDNNKLIESEQLVTFSKN